MVNQKKQKWITATGIGAFLFLIGLYVFFSMFFNPDGAGFGELLSYAGPVLPMTSLNGAEGVEVERNVDFDFTPYGDDRKYSTLGNGAARITDTYKLTNTTDETMTLELVYGFQGQFIDYAEEFPTITVDGVTIAPELYPSVDTEKLARDAYDFEKYAQVLGEQDFLTIAMEDAPEPDVTVTAYHFTGLSYDGTELASDPMLTVTYITDEDTQVWTDRVDSWGTVEDSDRNRMMFRVDRGEAWIFTIGGELQELEFGGNKGYNIYEGSALEEVHYDMEVYETSLMAVLEQFAKNYDFWAEHEGYPNPGLVTPELLVDGALKRMESMKAVEGIRIFSELFYQVVTEQRMMYMVFPVEIPAGAAVTVEASYVQEPSYDLSGPKEYREGYDMATKLGSDLEFTALTASVSNTGLIELGEQNFGFDLEQGVAEVQLDLSVERYYMEIYLKE